MHIHKFISLNAMRIDGLELLLIVQISTLLLNCNLFTKGAILLMQPTKTSLVFDHFNTTKEITKVDKCALYMLARVHERSEIYNS